MNKTIKRNVIVSAVLAIMLCVSLLAGATFALFTSDSKVNISVSSGKVAVVATVDEDSIVKTSENAHNEFNAIFNSASSTLAISGILPGDSLSFKIKVVNESTVAVKYRTVILCEADEGLFSGLKINVGNTQYTGRTTTSNYETLAVNANPQEVEVKVSLPLGAGNQYQGKTCKIVYKVEAIQGNAEVENTPTNVFAVYNASDLNSFAIQVANNTLESSIDTLSLMDNIDMSEIDNFQGILWNRGAFTFDGNNKTISNLKSTGNEVGLITRVTGETVIKNLTISNADITAPLDDVAGLNILTASPLLSRPYIDGNTIKVSGVTVKDCNIKGKYSGAIAGYVETAGNVTGSLIIENCEALNNTFESQGSAGALVGYTVSKVNANNVTVKGNSVKGDRSASGLVGSANATVTVTNATVENNTYSGINVNKPTYNDPVYGYIYTTADYTINGNKFVHDGVVLTAEGTYEISNAKGLLWLDAQVKLNDLFFGKTVKLVNDINLAGVAFTGIGARNTSSFPSYAFNGTFDGQNHVISNMSIDNVNDNIQSAAAGFFNVLGNNAQIKNIKFENATVKSIHYTGIVAGYCTAVNGTGVHVTPTACIENCHVNNSTAISQAHLINTTTYDDGDKVGGIVGYMRFEVKNCTVKNSTIQGVRDLGGIVGIGYSQVSNCQIENVKLVIDRRDLNLGTNVDNIIGRKETNNAIEVNCSGIATIENLYKEIANGVYSCAGEYLIYNANGMVWFATEANKTTTFTLNAKLIADIDMAGINWSPIGRTSSADWYGVFDGQNHKISNLTATAPADADDMFATGLFGWSKGTIKNLTLENANVSGSHYVGAIAGYAEIGSIENCKVINSTVTNTHADNDKCGDKAGGIAGYVQCGSVKNCSVTNTTITAGRDAGYIIGCLVASDGGNQSGNTYENVTLITDTNCPSAGNNMEGAIVGRTLE